MRFGPSQLSCLGSSVGRALCLEYSIECHGFESHPRQLIFSRKSDCLGCAVLLCLVCLFDLACFFLSSKNVHACIYIIYNNFMHACLCTLLHFYIFYMLYMCTDEDPQHCTCKCTPYMCVLLPHTCTCMYNIIFMSNFSIFKRD